MVWDVGIRHVALRSGGDCAADKVGCVGLRLGTVDLENVWLLRQVKFCLGKVLFGMAMQD